MTQAQLPDVVLDVRDLVTEFTTPDGIGRAVDSLSYTIARGETLGLVGESGCGKSISALSILQLIPSPPGHVRQGSAHLHRAGQNGAASQGVDLLTLTDTEIREIRGNDIAMVFQEPMTSLNPVLTIGHQIEEALRRHLALSKKAARQRAIEMLDLVRIPEPRQRAGEYPHQLSGGMRQRAMIAMALCCEPQVLIADEPTTALDVTIQAQVLNLIRDLQRELGTALLLITHDLAVVAETCDRVIVMYAGRKIEEAPVGELFDAPMHPYTQGLLNSVPRLGAAHRAERLNEIPGVVPPITVPRDGCLFAPRCPRADTRCAEQTPTLRAPAQPEHTVACWHPGSTP